MTATWHSLCCGLDATASWCMTAVPRPDRRGEWIGRFAPVPRMGGKRAYAADVRAILGAWPSRWSMIDADPAVVLWWSAVFEGWLDQVAERIRVYELDGEALWRSIVYANGQDGKGGPGAVPDDPVERLAAWMIGQKGNFSGKPLSWTPSSSTWRSYSWNTSPTRHEGSRVDKDVIAEDVARWKGGAGWADCGTGFGVGTEEGLAESVKKWLGVAGYGSLSEQGRAKGYPDRVIGAAIARGAETWQSVATGAASVEDLNTWAPTIEPGDLVTIDPPYHGTQGYADALPRERVVELAELADEAGARVLVHEAEQVITGGRWRGLDLRKDSRKNQDTWRGRGRHGKREVVTVNFEPAGRVGAQQGLFDNREE